MARIHMTVGAVLVALCLGTGYAAWALSLDEAKAKGQVGERTSGYLGAVTGGSAEVQALVNDVNQKRKQAYEEIATRNGTSLNSVEHLAGEKAIQNTTPGNMIEGPGGWVKK